MNDNTTITALTNGTTLHDGQYTIIDKIGEGGFGITYRAMQNQLRRMVCIKEYFLAGRCLRNTQSLNITTTESSVDIYEKYRQAFVKEAETVASLSHPNIVDVIDIFHENNTSYMVMPFIEGVTLETLIKRQGVPPMAEVMNYTSQIVDAVEYIHGRHILHRDIKPSNIIITPDYRAILIDFGSAREFIDDRTQAHTSILTHGYAPPEQYSTVSRKGAYSDVYSIGATLYFALTGVVPVDAAARITEPLPEPRQINATIPTYINGAIVRAMELTPSNRQQSAREFHNDLIGAKSHPADTKNPPNPHNTPTKKHHTWPIWLALSAVVIGIGIAVLLMQPRDNSTYPTTPEVVQIDTFPDTDRINQTLKNYYTAYDNNDFNTLSQLFTPTVERYFSKYNVTREYVIDCCFRYDDMFKVYSKHSEVRWNTLQIVDLGNHRVAVTYLEDYYLDREDTSKPTYFLLRKHIIMNKDYLIVSIYDDQVEKR